MGKKTRFVGNVSAWEFINFVHRVLILMDAPEGVGKKPGDNINPAAKYNKISIYLSFYNNSSISIRLESDDIIPEESIVEIINKDVNPVINIVSNKLEQSGYQLPQFLSLYDNNTRVIDLKFKSKLEISKNINFGKFLVIFNVNFGKF